MCRISVFFPPLYEEREQIWRSRQELFVPFSGKKATSSVKEKKRAQRDSLNEKMASAAETEITQLPLQSHSPFSAPTQVYYLDLSHV